MNRYKVLKDRQQAEFDAFPFEFAFSDEQYTEMMGNWGLDPEKDKDKVCHMPSGFFIQNKDLRSFYDLIERTNREMDEAIAEDETGEDFICDMFDCELVNHEFRHTHEYADTLSDLGFTEDEVFADKRLKRGLYLAIQKILPEDEMPKFDYFNEGES